LEDLNTFSLILVAEVVNLAAAFTKKLLGINGHS